MLTRSFGPRNLCPRNFGPRNFGPRNPRNFGTIINSISENHQNYLAIVREGSLYKLNKHDNSSLFNFGIQIVPEGSVRIVEKFGEFDRILEPGPHFLLPFVYSVPYTYDLKEHILVLGITGGIVTTFPFTLIFTLKDSLYFFNALFIL